MEELYLAKKKEFIDKQAAKAENKSTKESGDSQEKPPEKLRQGKADHVEDQKETEKAPAPAVAAWVLFQIMEIMVIMENRSGSL